MNPGQQQAMHAELVKTLIARILDITSNFQKPILEELSLAGLVNLLFLLRGEFGSLGDYASTQRALRHLVSDALYWKYPEPISLEIPANAQLN